MNATPFSIAQLRATRCRHMTAADAMSAEAIASQLQCLPEWRHRDGALHRRYAFANYYETMAFVNAAAWVAHQQDHHPELVVSYDRVAVAFSTHSAGGVSLNDFACAARLDEVYGK